MNLLALIATTACAFSARFLLSLHLSHKSIYSPSRSLSSRYPDKDLQYLFFNNYLRTDDSAEVMVISRMNKNESEKHKWNIILPGLRRGTRGSVRGNQRLHACFPHLLGHLGTHTGHCFSIGSPSLTTFTFGGTMAS